MNRLFTKLISTKLDNEGVAVRTNITIDMTNLTDSEILEIAVGACVIKAQATLRRAGKIPAEFTYVVPKPGTKVALTLDQQVDMLSDDRKAELLEKLKASMTK